MFFHWSFSIFCVAAIVLCCCAAITRADRCFERGRAGVDRQGRFASININIKTDPMSLFEACQGPPLAPVDNIFARIIRKEEPADIVWEDDTVVAFKDAHPASTVHLLIVPKHAAVRNPNHLTVQHVDLLEHMVVVGKQLLKERAGLTINQQTAQASLGFHMPPWTIVPHLHMHAIAPLRRLNWFQRVHFLVGSFWYKSAESILARLKSQQTTQLTL